MKYKIEASETIFYEVTVEADNEDQAREDVLSGNVEVDYGDVTDSDGFQIDKISEEEK